MSGLDRPRVREDSQVQKEPKVPTTAMVKVLTPIRTRPETLLFLTVERVSEPPSILEVGLSLAPGRPILSADLYRPG